MWAWRVWGSEFAKLFQRNFQKQQFAKILTREIFALYGMLTYMVAYEYTYQDHEYILRTMNTKYDCAVWLPAGGFPAGGFPAPSCTQDCSHLS